MSVHPASTRESDRCIAWTGEGGTAGTAPSTLRADENEDTTQDAGETKGSEETSLFPALLGSMTLKTPLEPIEPGKMRPRAGQGALATPSSPPPSSLPSSSGSPSRRSSGSPSPASRARDMSATVLRSITPIASGRVLSGTMGRRRSSVTAAVMAFHRSTKTILERAFHFAGEGACVRATHASIHIAPPSTSAPWPTLKPTLPRPRCFAATPTPTSTDAHAHACTYL